MKYIAIRYTHISPNAKTPETHIITDYAVMNDKPTNDDTVNAFKKIRNFKYVNYVHVVKETYYVFAYDCRFKSEINEISMRIIDQIRENTEQYEERVNGYNLIESVFADHVIDSNRQIAIKNGVMLEEFFINNRSNLKSKETERIDDNDEDTEFDSLENGETFTFKASHDHNVYVKLDETSAMAISVGRHRGWVCNPSNDCYVERYNITSEK